MVLNLSCFIQCVVVIWYILCSEHVLHFCLFLLECNWKFFLFHVGSFFANLSACSLPFIPQCAGLHCRTTLLCSNMLYNLRLRLCSPCPASESNTDRESVRHLLSWHLLGLSRLELLDLGLSPRHRNLCSIFL